MEEHNLKNSRILIVDDQAANVDMLEGFLEMEGFTNLQSTTDPREVFSLIAGFKPDLLLLDLMMPYITGYEVMAQIKPLQSSREFLPILVLTADITSEAKQRALSLGASDFLTKPFDLTEVGLRINNLLFTRSLMRQLQNQNQLLDEKVKERTSELQQANIELTIARDLAQESERLSTFLMQNLSHEFRTPLNGILGFAGLLKSIVQDDNAKNMVEYINISGNRLLATLTSILDLSQLESDKKIVNLSDVNLSEISHRVISKFSDMLNYKKLRLTKMIDENVIFHTDTVIVSNIFFYIIDNAIKFTETGEVWVTLRKSDNDNGEGIVFSVKDTGIGISDEQMKYIFEPFRQGSEGIGRTHEGNGLGLTLCKRFLDLLGAQIYVESRLEQGSTFTVFFNTQPLRETKEDILKVDAIPMKSISVPETKPAGKPHILVVEDNEINIELIVMYLANEFIVDKALNAKMALNLVATNHYDLVLMDINLGAGMDGIEAARLIRKMENKESLPIVAVTGYSTDNEKQSILSNGLTDYLSKPFTKAELAAVVKRVLPVTR